MDSGCVGDQPQRVTSSEAVEIERPLRLVPLRGTQPLSGGLADPSHSFFNRFHPCESGVAPARRNSRRSPRCGLEFFSPCTTGTFWKDSFKAGAMGNKRRQNAPQNFLVMGVTDCLLSELDRMGFG